MNSLFEMDVNNATFSPCRRYRYTLWRSVGPSAKLIAFIGLNPSTADETKDDPTIRRCKSFTQRLGGGTYLMLNLFAWRSTDPKVLPTIADPVGPENDEILRVHCKASWLVIACWGADEAAKKRVGDVLALIDRPIHCLGKNMDGTPKHPLYLPSDAEMQVFRGPVGELKN